MKKILLLMVAILLSFGCQPSDGNSGESGGGGGGGGGSPNPPDPTAIVTATPTPTTTSTATPTDTPTPSPTATDTATDTSTPTPSPTATDTSTPTSTPTPSAAVLLISDGATYNFGSVASGSSTDKTLTISRTGDSNATGMSGSGLAAPYSFKGSSYPGTGGTCSATLSAASCTIVVTLAPSSVGVYNDTIEINYNDGYAAKAASRAVTGMVDIPWSRRYGGTESEGAKPHNSYIDNTGNSYVAGVYQGAVNFGTGVLPQTNGTNIFVMKVDYDGDTQWVSTGVNSAGQTELYGFTGDSGGNSYAIGSFTETLIIDSASLVSAGGWDTWVAKWNSSGVFQWAKRFGTAGDFEHGVRVATNSSNDVYIAGAIAGTVNFGGGARTLKGTRDYYIAKFDTSGTWLWDMTAGRAGVDSGNGATLYVDGGNNLISTGRLYSTLTIGGVSLGTTCAGCDFWVVKYNSAGVAQYSRSYPTNTGVSPFAMTSDSANNIYATGYFQGTMGVDTGGGTLVSAGQEDIFAMKLNADGVELWSKRFGGTSGDDGYSLTLDTLGNLLVAGAFYGTVNFGSGNIASAGLSDMFLMKLNKNTGAFQSVATWGSTGEDHAESVRVDSINNSYIFGHFANTVSFIDGNQTSAGGNDLFIMKNVP